jgi:K+-transporting ATPase ATPase B chain
MARHGYLPFGLGRLRPVLSSQSIVLLDRRIALQALRVALAKLDPRRLVRNPVMFVVEVVAALATLDFLRALAQGGDAALIGQIAAWLWFTVLFANLAEAVAEGRGKARADALRGTQAETRAKRLMEGGGHELVSSRDLGPGDLVLVEAGDVIPADGDAIEGIASVDESAITGESARKRCQEPFPIPEADRGIHATQAMQALGRM